MHEIAILNAHIRSYLHTYAPIYTHPPTNTHTHTAHTYPRTYKVYNSQIYIQKTRRCSFINLYIQILNNK